MEHIKNYKKLSTCIYTILVYSIYMDNKEINNRLNRIEGQIAGLSKMIQVGDKDVLDVIQQIIALKSALEKVGVLILIEDLKNGDQSGAKLEKIFDYLIKLS